MKSLYDLPQVRRDALLRREASDDVLSGYDADEAVQIVHYRNEVLADDAVQQLLQRGGDADRGIFPEDIPDVKPFQVLHGARGERTLVREDPPEEVPLADGAHIPAFAVDDGDRAAAMVPELFQPLTQRVVVVQERDPVFGSQKISNIHSCASFLLGGTVRPVKWVDAIFIIYRKALTEW